MACFEERCDGEREAESKVRDGIRRLRWRPVLLRLFLLLLELRLDEEVAVLWSLSESWADEVLPVFSLLSRSMLSYPLLPPLW